MEQTCNTTTTIKEFKLHTTRAQDCKEKNFFLKGEFKGLILPNYSLSRSKPLNAAANGGTGSATATATNSKKLSITTGFPYPEHSGIPCRSKNQPVSHCVTLANAQDEKVVIKKHNTKQNSTTATTLTRAEIEKEIERENEIKVCLR